MIGRWAAAWCWGPVGLIAQAGVKLILHFRIRDNDARRPDAEQHGQAVLAVTPDPRIDDPCLCRGRVGTRRSSWPTRATSRVPGGRTTTPVRTPGSTSSNTWRWADVITSSFDASSTSTRSGSVNQPLSEPWHKLCSQSSCCERTIRVTGPAARRLLGRRRDVTQQKRLRHNNI